MDKQGVPSSESSGAPLKFLASEENEGQRLDVFLAAHCESHSRANLKKAISAGLVSVDDVRVKASHKMRPGETVSIVLPEPTREGPEPEPITLDILYEDEVIAVINKPAGMVVHPSKGHGSGTLAAGLRYHFEQLSTTGGPARPGIVHRLDRDTTGVIIVAKTDAAHASLSSQFAERTTQKEYLAIVVGKTDRDRDQIDRPIGRHPQDRERMAIRADHSTSREAQTFYEVVERFGRFALLSVKPKTGRTHQIRVHLASISLPVLCDRAYSGRSQITASELNGATTATPDEEPILRRQALHAHRLTVAHPTTDEPMTFEAPLPADMETVLRVLRSR